MAAELQADIKDEELGGLQLREINEYENVRFETT